MSQLALAERVGVSRQALIAIEAGRQVPSTSLSLQLARALGCRVDDLFELSPGPGVRAWLAPTAGGPRSSGGRVAMGRLGDRWVAHSIADDVHRAADGIVASQPTDGGAATVQPLSDLHDLERNVLVAGCAPLLGVLAQRSASRCRDSRMTWLPAGSLRALDLLGAGLVHVAGLHLVDERTGENAGLLRKHMPNRSLLVVNLTRWRQGFVVPRGNPKSIRGAGDLLRAGVRVAQREKGSGAEALARRLITKHGGRRAGRTKGPQAADHGEVAQLVRCGAADVGVAIEAVALAAGLDFVPLSEERFDLVLPSELASHGPICRVLDLLADQGFRAEAARMPGYDNSLSGQTTALDAA